MSLRSNLAGRKNLLEFSFCVTAQWARLLSQNQRLQSHFHGSLPMKDDSSKPHRVAFGDAFAHARLAEHGCWDRPATFAVAWLLANAGLPGGTPDLDRNFDSSGAAGTDSHTPFEDIAEMVEISGDDWEILSYLGM